MRTRTRERDRDSGRGTPREQEARRQAGGETPTKGGRGRSRQRGRRDRDRNRQRRQQPGARFWGDPSKLPEAPNDLRITEDPSAVARSLGPPPLPGHEVIAEHYFAAVYERAVATAGALAAAGGLIDPDTLHEELGS